jgi:hypothetical protein
MTVQYELHGFTGSFRVAALPVIRSEKVVMNGPTSRRLHRFVALLLVTVAHACAQDSRQPTAPSAFIVDTVAQTADWACLTRTTIHNSSSEWVLTLPDAMCAARAASSVAAASAGGAPVSGPPVNVRQTVTGTTVRLDWEPPPGEAVSGFLLEAGTAQGLSNIVSGLPLPASARSFTATNVPNGVYYVRVRGTGGPLGPPSADVVVRVGSVCSSSPGVPLALRSTSSGGMVTLAWDAPATGDAASSYLVEVGSASGLSDVLTLDTGNATRSLTAQDPPRSFYVRARARNGCGTSGPSNQIVVGPPGLCAYAVSPTTRTTSASAGSFDVTVTTTDTCEWTPSSLSSFITVDSPGTRTGSGTAKFNVAANAGTDREGRARISWAGGGQDVTVYQSVLVCGYTVSPATLSVASGASSFSVSVATSSPTCAWTPTSSTSFISVSSPGERTGSGSATFNVAANSGSTRPGTARISWPGGGQDVAVSQAGGVTYTASIDLIDPIFSKCFLAPGCNIACDLVATHNVPGANQFQWNLGAAGTPTTTTNVLPNVSWLGYCSVFPPSTGGEVKVSVTVIGTGGASAIGTGTIRLGRT